MSKFKIGDKVKIRKNSYYYDKSSISNPRDTLGEIINIQTYTISVRWENGCKNVYGNGDLELVRNIVYPDE